jgi:hypothetical protein
MTSMPTTQKRLEQLVITTSTLIGEVSIEGVLQQVVETAAGLIGARFAAIGVLAPDGRLLETFTTYGISAEDRARIGPPPRGHGILGLVIREARPIRLPDLTRHPDSYGFPPHHPPTFSVSNLGMFGIQEFTAIINPPEAGILAVGTVEEKPVAVEGEVAIRPRMRVTMSCDHRVVDGAMGAQFLATLRDFLEDPMLMVM